MIQFEGKMEFQDTNGIEISKIWIDPETFNNISLNTTKDMSDTLPYNYTSSRNPFIIGSSKLNGGATFSKKEQFLIGKELSVYNSENENYVFNNGEIVIDITFYVEDTSIISADNTIKVRPTIVFDSVNNAYPPTIRRSVPGSGSGSSVVHSVSSFIYTFPEDIEERVLASTPRKARLTLRISSWSKENLPMRIEAIYLSPAVKITKSSLKSFERNLMGASSQNEISYGLVSNSASIELFDIDGRLKSYIEQDLISGTFPIKVYLVDTLTGKSQRVLKSYASEFNYNNDDVSFSASMSDNLEELQNYSLTYSDISAGTSLYNTLETFLSSTPYANNHIYENGADTFLKVISSSKDYVYEGTAWDMINQLLLSANMVGFINEDGMLVIRKVI